MYLECVTATPDVTVSVSNTSSNDDTTEVRCQAVGVPATMYLHVHHVGPHMVWSCGSVEVLPGKRDSPSKESNVPGQWLLHVQGGERCAGQSEPGRRYRDSLPFSKRYNFRMN